MGSPQEWWGSLPPITKYWLTGAVATALATRFGLLSPWSIHLSFEAIFTKLQLWRLITPFLFFGPPSFPWLIQLFML